MALVLSPHDKGRFRGSIKRAMALLSHWLPVDVFCSLMVDPGQAIRPLVNIAAIGDFPPEGSMYGECLTSIIKYKGMEQLLMVRVADRSKPQGWHRVCRRGPPLSLDILVELSLVENASKGYSKHISSYSHVRNTCRHLIL